MTKVETTEQAVLQDTVFTYPEAPAPAVDHVSLSIADGEFVAVLGANGSGKSSLAKLLNALHLPTEGVVTIGGMDTREDALLWDIRKHAGMVFQNPDNQLVSTIVEEDVAFGLENLGVPPPMIREKVDEALNVVQMTDFRLAAPHMLSGGQKQRIAIAGVLAMQPRIIILDESTAMLDPSGRREVLDTIHLLHREHGITVVWITHAMDEAATAQRIVVLSQGQVALQGTPREVFAQIDRMRALKLDVPPMTEMARLLNQRGVSVAEDVLTVPEMLEELCRLSSRA